MRPLLEETREPAVFQRSAAGLACGAVRDRVLLEVHPRQRLAAAWAGGAESPVDEVHAGVVLPLLAELQRTGEILVDGGGQAVDLLVVQLRGQGKRRKPCAPQDLVRV